MTKKLPKNQKKMNALIRALDGTWNCDSEKGCIGCPFELVKDAKEFSRELSNCEHCGAVAIRTIAGKLFPNDKKMQEVV